MSRLAAGAAALWLAFHAGIATAADAARHNLQTPVTPVAREIYDLHHADALDLRW